MLTDARPLFEGLSASFADPLAIAAQQGRGTSSLVVAYFPPLTPSTAEASAYDLYVCHSGEVVAVARTTSEFRFPVMPARALRRFVEARDRGLSVRLSLYELETPLLRLFLETVYFAPCLKLHVQGAESAPLVAAQLRVASCKSGVLEFNDFSDPLRPRIRLLQIADVPPAGVLARHLCHVAGRVLLYDRHRNAQVAEDRGLAAHGVEEALEQAHRLSEKRLVLADRAARRLHTHDEHRRSATAAADDEAHLSDYLAATDARPRRVATSHPAATTLANLLALDNAAPEDTPDALALLLGNLLADDAVPEAEVPVPPVPGTPPLPDVPLPQPDAAPDALPVDLAPAAATPLPLSPPGTAAAAMPLSSLGTPVDAALLSPLGTPVDAALLSPLGTPVDAALLSLVADVRALVAHAVGESRGNEHAAHVAQLLGATLPPAPADAHAFLRGLLTGDPPKRWYGFKLQRRRAYKTAAEHVRALFDAHRHNAHPGIEALPALWARLQH